MPGSEGAHMIMKIGGAKLHIGIPATAQELGADNLIYVMRELEWFVKEQLCPVNRLYARDLKAVTFIHTDADNDPTLKALAAAHLQLCPTLLHILRDCLSLNRKGTNALLVVKT